MYVAYAYFELRSSGDLVLPVLGLPARVTIIEAPTVGTALAVALGLAAVLGVVIYLGVFRPLRTAPALARVVASLGLLLYLQAVVKLRFVAGTVSKLPIGSLLPSGSVEVAGVAVPVNRFVLAGLAIVVAASLWIIFKFTRFGLTTRASAENEKGALFLGFSPDRIGVLNWMLASLLASLSVILIVSVTKQLDPLGTSMLVVPALAAALMGGLSSFAWTTAAGLSIGMLQSVVLNYSVRAEWLPSWIPSGGIQQALPFLLIVATLALRGETLPGRSAVSESRLPASPRPRGVPANLLFGAAIVATGLFTLGSQWRLAIVVSMIAALIALSSVVLTGYVGQISLAQYAFAGVSGLTTAKLAADAGIAFPWAPLIAVAIATTAGVLVGVSAVRVRGMTLAIATVGAAVAIQSLVFESTALGGIEGKRIPRPYLFGIDLGFSATGADNFRPAFGLLVLTVLVLAFGAVANLRRGATGLRWLAVRANERAAAASGINVAATKLSAFAVASFIAGVGGILLGYQSETLSPESFSVFASLALLALTYLGGVASLRGALIAGLLASGGVLTHLSGGESGRVSDSQFAISGLALIVVAIVYPDGISGAIERGRHPAPPPPTGPERLGRGPGDPMTDMLEVEDLTVSYGGLNALDGVSFTVAEGAIIGLIGPNGAGKTTCIDALSGFLPGARGRVVMDGHDLSGSPAHRRARLGLVRTFQSVEMFDDLTVTENLLVAASRERWWSPLVDAVLPSRALRDTDVEWALGLVGLGGDGERYPTELSHGRRRLAGMARALAGRPRLLLLDEPAAGLDPAESDALAEVIRSLPGLGTTVLLVDHDMGLVFGTCETIHVLDFGRLTASGDPRSIRADKAVIDAYLGGGGTP